MVKVGRISLIDVLQIIVFVLVTYFFVYGFFTFMHDHLICDYSYYSSISDDYNFNSYDLSYSEIKYRYGVNVSGGFNQYFLLEDDVQVVKGCRFVLW